MVNQKYSTEQIRSEVEKIFSEVLTDVSLPINDEMTARNVRGWNSLNHVRIIVKIEERYKIEFRPREVVSLNNYGELIHLISKKVNTE